MGILSSKAQEDTNVESKTAKGESLKIVAESETQKPDENSQPDNSENKAGDDINAIQKDKMDSDSKVSQAEGTKPQVSDDNEKSSEKTDEMANTEDSKPDEVVKSDEVTSETSSEATTNKEESGDQSTKPLIDTTVDSDSNEATCAGSKRKDSPVTKSDDASSAQNKRTKVDCAKKCVEDIDKTATDDAPKDAVVA